MFRKRWPTWMFVLLGMMVCILLLRQSFISLSRREHSLYSPVFIVSAGAQLSPHLRVWETGTSRHVADTKAARKNVIVNADTGMAHVEDTKGIQPDSDAEDIAGTQPDSGVAAQHGGWGVVSSNDWDNPKSRRAEVVSFVEKEVDPKSGKMSLDQAQTSDHWPLLSFKLFPGGAIPKSPFVPRFTIKWLFDTTSFLQRPDVVGKPPKLITWMIPPRNVPQIPEPVPLRVCPEMPCQLTTNPSMQSLSAALLWNAQVMDVLPPARSNPDQVYVFHNNEPQKEDWRNTAIFRKPEWKSQFNWTATYRNDSDIAAFYGYVVKHPNPPKKNYTAIVAKKTKLGVWMSSHCETEGLREEFMLKLLQYIPVHVFGSCGPHSCSRGSDDTCFDMFNEKFKFLFAFENAFCQDYISEKFFRYLEADFIVVARGSDEYKYHAPPGTYINTNDFRSVEDLAAYLIHLDNHPEEYIQLLKRKDQYKVLFEDWPIRNEEGKVVFMQYHFEAIAYCEMCRRLWDLETYRKTIPDIVRWFDKGNCYHPPDL